MSHFLNKVGDSLDFNKIPNSNTITINVTKNSIYFAKIVLCSVKITKICVF